MTNEAPTIKIAKTEYIVEEFSTTEGGQLCYVLRAGNAKQKKTLIGRPNDNWFLWSTRNGMRGCGMPKLVKPIFRILEIA